MPERKFARACGTAEARELSESITMMAPNYDSQLSALIVCVEQFTYSVPPCPGKPP